MKRLLSLVAVLAISPITLAQDAKLVSGVELEYVSKELAPQDDFYSYVNEGWLKNTEIPSDQSNWGSFSVIDDEVKSNIRAIIETAAASDAEKGSNAQKVGDFFKSLTNVELRNKLGTKPVEPMLTDIAAVKDSKSMAKMAAKMARTGIFGLFAGYIQPDLRKSTQYAVYFTHTGITLPDRDYYLEDTAVYKKARKDLQEYIIDMMKAFGQEDPEGAAERIVTLETELAKIFW